MISWGNKEMDKKGTLYFFTGLAGAGKTTIGGLFYEKLKKIKPDAILVDGDRQREAAKQQTVQSISKPEQDDDRLYGTEARKRGAWAMGAYCYELTQQGKDVVLCSISMYAEIRAAYRKYVENYKEIYIRAQWETLYRRNPKGLYSSGRRNVVGVDLPWDEPDTPDVVIQNDGEQTPEEIVDWLEGKLLLGRESGHATNC